MLLFFAIYLFIPFLNGAVTDYKSYKNHKVYEIYGDVNNIQKLKTYLSGFGDIPSNSIVDSRAEVMIAPDLDEIFSNATEFHKLHKKMIVADFSKIIQHAKGIYRRTKLSSSFSWKAYYDVDDIYGFLKNMSKTYSDWTSLVVGGQSYEGRQILGLRINTPPSNNTKPIVFIESGIHAREWIAPATTTYFINQLMTSSDPAIKSLRDKFDWHIFPTVNPDGYHYAFTTDRLWRKTRSKTSGECYGADPNRNWDYNWGKESSSANPCNNEYAGSKAFSEVETRTLSEYIKDLKNITAYIGFHSCAQMLLVPFSDSTQNISNFSDLVKIGKTSIEYGRKVNGQMYRGPATAANILYPASGGSMDWVRYKLNTPLVFTYELRGPGFHWPEEKIPEQGDEVTQMMLGLFTEACNIGYC